MNIYLIVLQGQGDEYVAVVDQETWDWINSDIPQSAHDDDASAWSEWELMPVRTRNALIANTRKGDEADPLITIGSYENDRAMAVCTASGAALYDAPDVADAKKWVKDNGYMIVETYRGCIY